MSPATKVLMMSLTSDPSVGNYNICRHDKAAHKDGSTHSLFFWEGGLGGGDDSSSPVIMSGFERCRVSGVMWVLVVLVRGC